MLSSLIGALEEPAIVGGALSGAFAPFLSWPARERLQRPYCS